MPAARPAASTYDTHVNREASSKAFEARQAPAFKATVGDRVFTPQQVQQTRTTYYTTVYRDRYIPASTGTSYGSFSETFMWAMMFNAAFAHNRQDDPDYRRWRRDADERARNDEKVKEQLAKLDAEVAALRSQPVNPNFVPSDVPIEAIFTEASLTTKQEAEWDIGTWLMIILGLAIAAFAGIAILSSTRKFA